MPHKRILYISDLDGTLLRKDQTVSHFSANTIGKLMEKGLLFAYATARSYATASKVTANLPFRIPVIVFNGSFIVDPHTENRLFSAIFTPEETKLILDTLLRHEIFPVVNAFIEGRERFSQISGKETRGILMFLRQRQNDIRHRPVHNAIDLYEGEVFHVACIDTEEKLRPLYEHFKNEFPCVLYRDVYSGDTWFELHPKSATKANAILTLKKMLGCDQIVCFGDGKNDISMFQIADECYAVANAEAELQAMATAVIESNEDDGVAKWLEGHAIFA